MFLEYPFYICAEFKVWLVKYGIGYYHFMYRLLSAASSDSPTNFGPSLTNRNSSMHICSASVRFCIRASTSRITYTMSLYISLRYASSYAS